MENSNYYAILPANVRYDSELTANEKLFYAELTTLCNKSGGCWAKNKYFADIFKVSKETISRWISKLEKKGYIYKKIFYKKDSKEIDKRVLSITPFTEKSIGLDKKIKGYCHKHQRYISLTKKSRGIDANVKDNNNNNNNNNKELEKCFKNCLNLENKEALKECITYLDKLPFEVIEWVLKRTSGVRNPSWNYAKTVLNDFVNRNINTLEKIEADREKYQNKNQNSHNKNNKIQKMSETSFTQRKYSEDFLNSLYSNRQVVG